MQRRATAEDAGSRLDAFLAAPLGSRARAQRLIEAGLVLVDGRAAPKRHLLSAGELVTVDEPEEAPAPAVADAPYSLPYADEHLLVVDKPAGVVVHPARGHPTGTLAQALSAVAAGGEDAARAGIVHRLDRDTSGLLVVARSEAVHRALRRMLQAREITREYLALVEGRPPARSGTIDAPLGRDRRVRTRMSTDSDDPRGAVTHFELERALPRTTLLRVRLETGRTHQIRAHLQAIEHPVVGDPEYGTPGRLGLERQFLHAARLAFAHPVTGAPIDVSSPLPEDLRAALARAGAE
jgi:23S rRNA pseudouridine1911/1915/1917 synthase